MWLVKDNNALKSTDLLEKLKFRRNKFATTYKLLWSQKTMTSKTMTVKKNNKLIHETTLHVSRSTAKMMFEKQQHPKMPPQFDAWKLQDNEKKTAGKFSTD